MHSRPKRLVAVSSLGNDENNTIDDFVDRGLGDCRMQKATTDETQMFRRAFNLRFVSTSSADPTAQDDLDLKMRSQVLQFWKVPS